MKAIAYILIMVYATALLVPFTPYLDYAINKDYIATELCENVSKPELNCEGMCYLQDQLIIAAQSSFADEPNQEGPTTNQQLPFQPHTDLSNIPFLQQPLHTLNWMSKTERPESVLSQVDTPPPRA